MLQENTAANVALYAHGAAAVTVHGLDWQRPPLSLPCCHAGAREAPGGAAGGTAGGGRGDAAKVGAAELDLWAAAHGWSVEALTDLQQAQVQNHFDPSLFTGVRPEGLLPQHELCFICKSMAAERNTLWSSTRGRRPPCYFRLWVHARPGVVCPADKDRELTLHLLLQVFLAADTVYDDDLTEAFMATADALLQPSAICCCDSACRGGVNSIGGGGGSGAASVGGGSWKRMYVALEKRYNFTLQDKVRQLFRACWIGPLGWYMPVNRSINGAAVFV